MTPDRKEDSMSHVDEGTLHAYLDAELPSGERAALESHLAQCATCRAQLAEERALLERSTALLGSTRPLDRALPPFEQVRRAPRRRWYMPTGFAWAASLLLAVGFGYYLSEQVAPHPQPAAVDRTAVASLEADTILENVPPAARRENAPAQKSTAGRRATDKPAPRAPAAENSYTLRLDSTQPPAVTLRGQAQAPAPLPLDTSRRVHDSARALVNALEEAPVTAAPEASIEGHAAGAPSANRSDSRSVRNLVSTTWPLISRGKAASLLGDRPVGVPGLATRGIHSSPAGDGTVVVEQALDSKTVIQIFQRPASSAETDEFVGRERADRVLARYVGRLRVEISGPVSTDSLNKLLEQVEPIP
jgi:anti-sigma factor RsiW